METAWPAMLSEWPECREEYAKTFDGETLLWNGPRVNIGITFGKPQYRKPLNTGRNSDAAHFETAANSMLPHKCVPALQIDQAKTQKYCLRSLPVIIPSLCCHAYEKADTRQPTCLKPVDCTGRADYYGSTVNLASRVCNLAQPGQILLEGSSGFTDRLVWSKDFKQHHATLPVHLDPSGLITEDEVELKLLGFYRLRVSLHTVYQTSTLL